MSRLENVSLLCDIAKPSRTAKVFQNILGMEIPEDWFSSIAGTDIPRSWIQAAQPSSQRERERDEADSDWTSNRDDYRLYEYARTLAGI
jgi:hypothetical protein